MTHDFNISEKTNHVLNIILIVMIFIAIRLWHLAVVQYDAKVEESRRPQRRMVVEAARRATIRDRFNVPLALNKVQYRASILYSQFKSIPSVTWTKDSQGNRIKVSKRKEYINNLSKLLADELQLDADRLEDLIHAKAAMYYNIPFVIKDDLTEKEYYRLKMLEKDWVGIQVQRMPKRTYPMGRVASDIIGFMGAIDKREYESIVQEIKALDTYVQAYESGEDAELPQGVLDISHARHRLNELQEHAYTVTDYVGKMGIEGQFEEELRGFRGKKFYYSDARGNFLRELPGASNPLPGNRILLTISAELQEFAETLLAQNENIREAKLSHANEHGEHLATKQPWIKGGAIIAMDPHSGEILAMASHPRFDPNDFIASSNTETLAQKRANILRWFESEEYIAQVWDQKRPLERERFDDKSETVREEALMMTWEHYLDAVLHPEGVVRDAINQIRDVKSAIELQRTVKRLLELSGQENLHYLFNVIYNAEDQIPFQKQMSGLIRSDIEKSLSQSNWEVSKLKGKLNKYFTGIPQHYDKVLLVDLCRMVVCEDAFSEELLQLVGKQNIDAHRTASGAMASIEPVVKRICKAAFHDRDFKTWKKTLTGARGNETREQAYIKQKRAEEVRSHKYPKPYIDYLDALENQMFTTFWNKNKWVLITAFLNGQGPVQGEYVQQLLVWHDEIKRGAHQGLEWKQAYSNLQQAIAQLPAALIPNYLQTLRSYHDLNRTLYGKYRHLRKQNGKQLEKHLAAAFYPLYGFGYGRSYAYRQATTQGSLFKLVTAYAALVQRYNELDNPKATPEQLNPLEIFDEVKHTGKEWRLGFHADGSPLPQFYKGGRLIKSSMRNIGHVDLVKAIEVSSNPYFSLLAGDYLHSPNDLLEAAKEFSYGSKTGIELPAELAGRLPQDVDENKTGLYALAIGQHTLVTTPLQTSVMLSAIANGGKVMKPKIVNVMVNTENIGDEGQILCPPKFPYQEELALAGIDFPLFTAVPLNEHKNQVSCLPNGVQRELFMPDVVRKMLLEGMQRSVVKMHQSSFSSLSRFYSDYPEAISDYLEVKDHLVGKTSTAESMENIDLDLAHGTNLYTHVWFGGISFDEKDSGNIYVSRDDLGSPDLVVVVYLRYGHFGKEATPIAAQMVKKWREIRDANKKGNGA